MIALLDACVLYPAALRDVLMWLAVTLAYEPRWTDEIHAEWMRNVLIDYPNVLPAQLERTRVLMDRVSPNCLVSGYDARIPDLALPDENDRHVLAAAIESGASVIVTFNLRTSRVMLWLRIGFARFIRMHFWSESWGITQTDFCAGFASIERLLRTHLKQSRSIFPRLQRSNFP